MTVGGGRSKDETATKPAIPPESDKEQKRNLAYLVVLAGVSAGRDVQAAGGTDRGRSGPQGGRFA